MNENNKESLVHVGKYLPYRKGPRYLYLRKRSLQHYVWYEKEGDQEVETEVDAPSIEEAMQLAHKTWKNNAFRTVICGFRYTLPERDEHGMNALFHQMAASYSTPNGVYFDEELGHNCFVQSASREALDIWNKIRESKR